MRYCVARLYYTDMRRISERNEFDGINAFVPRVFEQLEFREKKLCFVYERSNGRPVENTENKTVSISVSAQNHLLPVSDDVVVCLRSMIPFKGRLAQHRPSRKPIFYCRFIYFVSYDF